MHDYHSSPPRASSPKFGVYCSVWRPLRRNTLRGFATVTIPEICLEITDIALHVKGERRWAQLPSKPMIRDGVVLEDDSGKPKYLPILRFTTRQVSDAFSAAVIRAVLERDPTAFGDGAVAS
jgi:hypothetical protein